MLPYLLASGLSETLAGFRTVLIVVFVILSISLILFVLFRQTDSSGLSAAFGGGGGSGEGAFGAKGHKVADKIIAWMCGLFIVLSLMIAVAGSNPTDIGGDQPDSGDSEAPAE